MDKFCLAGGSLLILSLGLKYNQKKALKSFASASHTFKKLPKLGDTTAISNLKLSMTDSLTDPLTGMGRC